MLSTYKLLCTTSGDKENAISGFCCNDLLQKSVIDVIMPQGIKMFNNMYKTGLNCSDYGYILIKIIKEATSVSVAGVLPVLGLR